MFASVWIMKQFHVMWEMKDNVKKNYSLICRPFEQTDLVNK